MAKKGSFQFLLAIGLVLFGAFVSLQCSDDKKNDNIVRCVTDNDCPKGMICQDKHCVEIPADQDEGPSTCMTDADCGAEDQICLNGTCVPKYPSCPPAENCYPCQTCNELMGMCEGEPCFDQTDGDEEKADGDTSTDGELQEADNDDQTEPPTEQDNGSTNCRKDSDCPEGKICSPQLRCVDDCTTTGCESDEGTCNPKTGHCEWCDPQCDEGEECNYNSTAWYCGSPCEPPCPEGYACQGGQCVELRCPDRCPPGYYCSGNTGYVCRPSENEQEYRSVPAPVQGATCLPPTAPCIEGVSECCSGACIMGHCM